MVRPVVDSEETWEDSPLSRSERARLAARSTWRAETLETPSRCLHPCASATATVLAVGKLKKYFPRRSHMIREHLPPVREQPEEVIQIDRDQVVVRSYVGGLVKSLERRAA
jgi:hypothetical protein